MRGWQLGRGVEIKFWFHVTARYLKKPVTLELQHGVRVVDKIKGFHDDNARQSLCES